MRKYLGIGVAVLLCVNSAYAAYIPTRLNNLHVGTVSQQSATSDAIEVDVPARFDSTVEVNGVSTLADDETLTNTSDTLTLAGDDNDTTFSVKGFEAKTAGVVLSADESDDPGDDWTLKSDTDNSFTVGIDTPTAGTVATKLKIDFAGEVTSTALEGTDASVTLQADESDDNGDDWKIESDQATNSLIISNDTSGSQAAKATVNTTGDLLLGGAKVGTVDAQGNTQYELIVTSVIATGNAYPLTPADGKAGSFIVIAGTFTVTGSFTSAAAVTLGLSSTDTSTTDNNAGTVNVYDGGTVVYVENQIGASLTATIRYNYVN